MKAAWNHILRSNLHISLKEPAIYYLQVDWRSKGYGYFLYAGAPERGVLVRMNSKGVGVKAFSSFLGEMKALCWALQDVKQSSGRVQLVFGNW